MKRNNTLFLIILLIIFCLGGIYFYENFYSRKNASVQENTFAYNTQKTDEFSENGFSSENENQITKDSDLVEQNKAPDSVQQKKIEEIPFLEIPLCPNDALLITQDDTHGVLDTPEKEDTHQIVEHTGYTLCYREKYEQPEWVCYTLTPEKNVKATNRKDNFRPDPKVITGSASLSDYKSSGYDRGHLAPSADMTYSEITMDESFFLSNMSPQSGSFNRGLWKELEQTVRDFTEDFEKLWIVTGPVLEKNDYPAIGKNEVSVPEYYYKAILGKKSQELFMIGFILPNEKCEGTVWDYAVSIDEIEERTGIDFFYRLQDEKLENTLDVSAWKK